ncbi:uncharacterized protein MONBRDRAFT_28311 [Monosiga brevicollis MX1]|uniref:PX domain-containing protein n=1 Tax=Monosiga brevicollis TaxID=81824 RepID=A9V7T2_MONBE|nr:uncharacterized protein MONBRDRAFT_28311 [Monosiga brevicollis MX1]EDQ86359.1 predicted protein [Monosiga brevicollis MX1]|eukprot:XP_001748749.1 hypothetical protein [Monosiga brevicollis MX1]
MAAPPSTPPTVPGSPSITPGLPSTDRSQLCEAMVYYLQLLPAEDVRFLLSVTEAIGEPQYARLAPATARANDPEWLKTLPKDHDILSAAHVLHTHAPLLHRTAFSAHQAMTQIMTQVVWHADAHNRNSYCSTCAHTLLILLRHPAALQKAREQIGAYFEAIRTPRTSRIAPQAPHSPGLPTPTEAEGAPLSATIRAVERDYINPREFAFVLEVVWRNSFVGICRRTHDQFFDFQCQLLDTFPDDAQKESRIIPRLPGKKIISTKSRHEIALARREGIQDYLNELFKLPPRISQCKLIVQFFRSCFRCAGPEGLCNEGCKTHLSDVEGKPGSINNSAATSAPAPAPSTTQSVDAPARKPAPAEPIQVVPTHPQATSQHNSTYFSHHASSAPPNLALQGGGDPVSRLSRSRPSSGRGSSGHLAAADRGSSGSPYSSGTASPVPAPAVITAGALPQPVRIIGHPQMTAPGYAASPHSPMAYYTPIMPHGTNYPVVGGPLPGQVTPQLITSVVPGQYPPQPLVPGQVGPTAGPFGRPYPGYSPNLAGMNVNHGSSHGASVQTWPGAAHAQAQALAQAQAQAQVQAQAQAQAQAHAQVSAQAQPPTRSRHHLSRSESTSGLTDSAPSIGSTSSLDEARREPDTPSTPTLTASETRGTSSYGVTESENSLGGPAFEEPTVADSGLDDVQSQVFEDARSQQTPGGDDVSCDLEDATPEPARESRPTQPSGARVRTKSVDSVVSIESAASAGNVSLGSKCFICQSTEHDTLHCTSEDVSIERLRALLQDANCLPAQATTETNLDQWRYWAQQYAWLKGMRLHKYAHAVVGLSAREMHTLQEEQLKKAGLTSGATRKLLGIVAKHLPFADREQNETIV